MEIASKLYSTVLKPSLDLDFSNKKEYNFLVTNLNAINSIMGIVQIRQVLLTLLYLNNYKDILTYKSLKKIVESLTAFHLMYNAICSKRTSGLESPLDTFAYNLLHSITKNEISETVNHFKTTILELIPDENEFISNFITLKYSKKNLSTNMLTKFVINKWQCLISNSDILPQDSSIEHIIDENTDADATLNIGNLILLEQNINSSIPHNLPLDKKIPYYKQSKYEIVSSFINETKDISSWDTDKITSRATSWAKSYYAVLKEIIITMS